MIETLKRTIDGLDFELSQMAAWQALTTFTRVTKFLAPGLDAVAAASGGDKSAVVAGLIRGLQGLAASNPTELRALTEVLLGSCIVTHDGKLQRLLPVFDVVMQGRILTVFKLLAWALEENYPDFFAVVKSGLVGLKAKAALSSVLPNVFSSTGPATG
jgi:hypothetical protein